MTRFGGWKPSTMWRWKKFVFSSDFPSCLWCCGNSKQWFGIIAVYSFLKKYVSLRFVFISTFCFFHRFFMIASYFHRSPFIFSIHVWHPFTGFLMFNVNWHNIILSSYLHMKSIWSKVFFTISPGCLLLITESSNWNNSVRKSCFKFLSETNFS